MKMLLKLIITLLLISANLVIALVENLAKERECISPGVDPSLNWKWVDTVKKWYVPAMSKYELYRSASELLEKEIKDISPEEIQHPCMVVHEGFQTFGFNRTEGVKYITQIDDDFVLNFHTGKEQDLKGKTQIALTDNLSFIVGVQCWENSQASWSILSTKKTIDPEIKAVLYDYLKSLGFNMKFLVEDDFENCKFLNDYGQVPFQRNSNEL